MDIATKFTPFQTKLPPIEKYNQPLRPYSTLPNGHTVHDEPKTTCSWFSCCLLCPRKQWTIKCKGGKQSDLGQEGNKGQNSLLWCNSVYLHCFSVHPKCISVYLWCNSVTMYPYCISVTETRCIPVYLSVSLVYAKCECVSTVSQCICGVSQCTCSLSVVFPNVSQCFSGVSQCISTVS